jgi:hypothetical protein
VGSHIATTDTFFVDSIDVGVSKCWICGIDSKHELGWIGSRCDNCKSVYDFTEITMPAVVRMRRELLKLSRREIAEKMKYSIHSIRYYENNRCSSKYYKATELLVRMLYEHK